MRKRERRTILVRVGVGEDDLLLVTLFGKTLIQWQLESLVGAGWDTIIVFMPVDADGLRAQIRELAVGYPVRVETVNLRQAEDFWSEAARRVDVRVAIGEALDFTLPFVAGQLLAISGDLVASVQTEKTSINYGSVRIKGRYISTFSSVHVRESVYLTGCFAVSSGFWSLRPAELGSLKDRLDWWRSVAAEQTAKAVEFEPDDRLPRLLVSDNQEKRQAKLWQLGQAFGLQVSRHELSQRDIASTARVSDRAIVSPGVRVEDFCVIGPGTYLGPGTQVCAYTSLTGVIAENDCRLGPYVYARDTYWPAGSRVAGGVIGID